MRLRPWFGGYKTRSGSGDGCQCKQVARFLAALGMPQAARMHADLASQDPTAWSPAEWRHHIAEEETVLSPLFRRYGLDSVADRMETEHRLIQAELDQYGHIVSLSLITSHSDMEDDAVIELERRIKQAA